MHQLAEETICLCLSGCPTDLVMQIKTIPHRYLHFSSCLLGPKLGDATVQEIQHIQI